MRERSPPSAEAKPLDDFGGGRSIVSALVGRLGAWQRGSIHRRILSAAALVAVFTVLGKFVGAAKEVVVAHRFGASDEVDAFLLASLLPTFAVSLFGNSMRTALVPTYIQLREREGPAAAQRLLSSVLVATIALLTGAAILIALVVPWCLPLIAKQYTPSKLHLTTQLTYVMIPAMTVAGMNLTWSAILNAHERFAIPAAATVSVPIVAIVGLLAFGRTWGIYVLAVAWLAGLCLEAAFLAMALRREGVSVLPRWRGVTPAVRQVMRQYAPGLGGSLVLGTNPVIDSVMAASLGTGAVAFLGYGVKLEAFAMSVVATSLSAAVLPHFSRLVAFEDWRGLGKIIRKYATVLLLISGPVTIALIALSEPIVQLLFERGAFTHSDTIVVARVQAFYLAAIPFRIVGQLFVRFIQAVNATVVLMWVNILGSVVNISLNYVLSIYLGVAGIALSTTLVYVTAVSLMFLYTRRRLRSITAAAPAATAS